MVIYENGQYDSRYFGENVSIVNTSSYNWVNPPKVEFKSNHIELTASGTYYWQSRTTYFKFIDALIAENSEVWVTMEITNVNNYYSFTRVLNSDPYPYDPSASGSAQYIQAEGNTVSGRYKIVGRNSDGNLQLIIMLDNNGSYTYKITKIEFEPYIPSITSNGGGATHIAKVTGQLKDLSSYTSDILMVSGGGGGGLLVGETEYTGKEAGGISGSGDNSADQSTGNAFGLGESGTNVSGGGSGLYGGYKGTSSKSGGAGSGYIGNSLLSNKKMVGYNVPTSSSEGTKTESVNDVSASAVANKPKSGNGFARIKFLQEIDFFGFIEHMDVTDSSTRFEYYGENIGYTPLTVDLSDTHLPSYNSWSNFSWLLKNKPYMVKTDGTADYQLSEADYTKKADGVTASDVKNTSYNGCGAFAWLPKIYTRQEIIGNDRYVYFSLTPKTGYDALGFKCLENGVEKELEGLWIPMFYGNMQNSKLMSICNDGKPTYNITIGAFRTGIENLSSRARFFGGAIINVIADLLMLLSRKGDIPTVFGNGVINASQSAWYPDTTIPTQSVVGTDRFWGYNDGNHLTKIFHSLLSSGILWQYDPYFKVKNSKFYHCPHYEWGEDVASDISAETTSGYYYATQFGLVDGFGRVPIHPMSSTAIEPYYMYINSLISPSDSYSCRNGNYGTGRRGWYARTFDSNFNYTAWDRNASPMILPPVGYKPE